MKALIASLVLLGAFSAQAESLYVINKSVADGRKIENFPIRSLVDVRFVQLFGMSKETDQAIASLDYQKSYKCEIDGTKTYVRISDGNNSYAYAGMLKVYGISSCAEVKQGDVLKAIRAQDEIDNPNR